MALASVTSTTVTPAAVIRRWRTIGIVVALVVSLATGLPAQRLQVDTITLVIGWLAGLLVARRRVHALFGQAMPEAVRRRAAHELGAAVVALGLLCAAQVLLRTFGEHAFGRPPRNPEQDRCRYRPPRTSPARSSSREHSPSGT